MLSAEREKKFNDTAKNRDLGLVVIIEDIHDPHNAAAILRSCDAFGVQRVCFIFGKEERYNPKKIGKATSSSANKWLDFEIFDSAKTCFEKLRSEGFSIFATILDENARAIKKINFKKKKVAIIVGNEHRGISEEAARLADEKVYIPMQGMVQSLNVSVSAGICLFEARRQRGARFSASKKEAAFLLEDFRNR